MGGTKDGVCRQPWVGLPGYGALGVSLLPALITLTERVKERGVCCNILFLTSKSSWKECQLDLYADRTSAATMRANQLRLWFASMAYVLLCALRRIGLDQTHFANATCGTIRLKLLKIGALVQFSVRRIKVGMASACPAADIWGEAARRLAAASARGSPA